MFKENKKCLSDLTVQPKNLQAIQKCNKCKIFKVVKTFSRSAEKKAIYN